MGEPGVRWDKVMDAKQEGLVCLVPSGELQGGRFQLNDLAVTESSHKAMVVLRSREFL